jgi:CDP-paratose 2-epimerase
VTALVTGGAGFIGTNVADRLLREGERVRVFDNLARAGVAENLAWLRQQHGDRLEIELGDVRDPHAVARATHGVDRVFHFAAQVAVTTSLDDPLADFTVNVEGTVRLLEALRGTEVPLLFTSTNKVYGALAGVHEPVSERCPLDFCTPYGCSKGGADQYVLDYAKSFALPAVVFRMSCIYGPHQNGTEDQGWVAHFAIRAQDSLPVTIYGDGRQVRDLLFVDDLVEAMQLAHEHAGALTGTAFNLGGGAANALSVADAVELVGASNVSYAEERPGDQRYYVADTRRFREATGWSPLVDAAEGIERLLHWLRHPVEAAA